MHIMKRRLAGFVLACLASLVASSTAHAYRMGEQSIIVKIDFDFTAGGKTFLAGSYRVAHPTSDFSLIEIGPDGGTKNVLVAIARLARGTTRGAPASSVVFEKVAGKFVLTEVWLPDLDGFLMRREEKAPKAATN
jgi:hypothetical protein